MTCGSDGMWYQNVCILRYQRCVYNIIVQRDRDEISCKLQCTYVYYHNILKKKKIFIVVITFSGIGVPVPDFTAVTPAVTPVATATAATPPSTAMTPTPDPQLQAAVCRALPSFTVKIITFFL